MLLVESLQEVAASGHQEADWVSEVIFPTFLPSK